MSDVFSRRVAELCGGRSIAECARLWEIPQPTLDRYVKAQRSPTADAIVQLCRATGASADWILGLDDAKTCGNPRAEAAESKLAAVKKSLIALVKEL